MDIIFATGRLYFNILLEFAIFPKLLLLIKLHFQLKLFQHFTSQRTDESFDLSFQYLLFIFI